MIRHILLTLALTVTAQAQTTPVLLAVVDDVGRDMLADAEGHTPSLDRLAAEGLWFENFWAAPACSQFRSRAMTGSYAFRAESLMGGNVHESDGWSIPTPAVLPSAVQGGTFLAGKWHLGIQARPTHAMDCGWTHAWYTLNNLGSGGGSYYGGEVFVDGQPGTFAGYVTSLTAAQAHAAVVRGDRLVYAAFHAPHRPFHEPPDELHTYGDLTGATKRELALAMLEAADTSLGRLTDEALTRGYTVIVCSDNGTSGKIGGGKGQLTEAGVRTWMVVAGAGVRAGEVSDRLVDATDLYATVTEIANGQPSFAADSISFAPELYVAGAGAMRDTLFVDKFSPNGVAPLDADWKRALRDARWKAVWPDGGPTSTPTEFYDLALDPGETTNLLVPGPLNAEQQAALDALLAVHP